MIPIERLTMSRTLPISLETPARFVEVEKKQDDQRNQLRNSENVPLWRFRCLIGTEVRAVTCPASTEEIQALKQFAPVHFSGLVVGCFKENLYLRATGLNQNPEGLPLRRR